MTPEQKRSRPLKKVKIGACSQEEKAGTPEQGPLEGARPWAGGEGACSGSENCPTPSPANLALPALVRGWWTKPHEECQGLAVPRASRLRARGTGKAWPRTLSEGLCGPLGARPGECPELARVGWGARHGFRRSSWPSRPGLMRA